jgi:hypothetical protein
MSKNLKIKIRDKKVYLLEIEEEKKILMITYQSE